MSLMQTQDLKQLQKITSQQIQFYSILALQTNALEEYIENEIAANPALEFESAEEAPKEQESEISDLNETPESDYEETYPEGKLGEDYDYTDYMDRDSLDDYKFDSNNYNDEQSKRESIHTEKSDFRSSLISQLQCHFISEEEMELGIYVINSLDDDGYLRKSTADIADEISFSQSRFVSEDKIEKVRSLIHTLEPAGMAACNLQECLLIQLKQLPEKNQYTELAIQILEKYSDELAAGKLMVISNALGIEDKDLKAALKEIRKTNPKPGGCSKEDNGGAITIQPDFTVLVSDEKVELFLNSPKHAMLKINEECAEIAKNASSKRKSNDSGSYIKSKVESAKWFIEALKQRDSLMIKVAKAVVKHQHKFFLTGDPMDLNPLILKNIAEEISADISTVSRIVNSKYIQTSFGTILIKSLFAEGMSKSDGEVVSTNEVKKMIVECLNAEDKNNPLSDEQIVERLADKNYLIARRTVAKYREELNIPNRKIRKVA